MKPARPPYELEFFVTSFPERRLAEWYQWEFLRRNPEYRADYKRFVDTHGKWLGRKGYWNDLSRSLKWTKADEKYYFSKIVPDIVLLCAKWRISDVDPPERRYAKNGGGRFRPDRPSRPATGLEPELIWDYPLMKELIGLGFTGRGGSARRKGHLLLIEFDLKWPLKDQVDYTKRILKRALDNYNFMSQKHRKRIPTGRRRFDDYDIHLKAWDLNERGKSAAQIARKLFPLDHGDSALQKVRDHVDAARRLICGRYTEIR